MARKVGTKLLGLLKHRQPSLPTALTEGWSGRGLATLQTEPESITRFSPSKEQSGGQKQFSALGLLTAFGGLAVLGYTQQSFAPATAYADSATAPESQPEASQQVDELAVYRRVREKRGLPKEVLLYQYEVCPFCNKVRAFLDYHKVPYRTVEVNPLTKQQLKWSEYKKVPVVMLDEEVINDSSLILSQLAVEFEEPQAAGKGSWFSKPSKTRTSGQGAAEEEEEIKWRRWVDKRFVQVITVNIYRTLRESWQTFDYITEHGNFNFMERQAARIAGSGMMYGISGKLIKKYGIEGDLREALLAAANEWTDAVGPDRTFMGGDKPNLADLSMFGVIRSITGTDTFMDLQHQSRISGWYESMMTAVGPSSRIAD